MLGVIGLVVGGIWVAASAVQENLRQEAALKGIIEIASNMRALYAGQTDPRIVDITAEMISANIIPKNFISGTTAKNPWGSNINIYMEGAAFPPQFRIDFFQIPKAACIKLVTQSPTNANLISLRVRDSVSGTILIDATSFPVDVTTAMGCAVRSDMYWRFELG